MGLLNTYCNLKELSPTPQTEGKYWDMPLRPAGDLGKNLPFRYADQGDTSYFYYSFPQQAYIMTNPPGASPTFFYMYYNACLSYRFEKDDPPDLYDYGWRRYNAEENNFFNVNAGVGTNIDSEQAYEAPKILLDPNPNPDIRLPNDIIQASIAEGSILNLNFTGVVPVSLPASGERVYFNVRSYLSEDSKWGKVRVVAKTASLSLLPIADYSRLEGV